MIQKREKVVELADAVEAGTDSCSACYGYSDSGT